MDQFGGGRSDPNAAASARLWYAANVAAAGIPLMFMGTEWGQSGWWDTTPERRPNWHLAQDAIGRGLLAAVGDANALRARFPALRSGWPSMTHEDRPNGVMAWERNLPGEERVVAVVNAGRAGWSAGEYACFFGDGAYRQVYCSSDERFGGPAGVPSNGGGGVLRTSGGLLHINLPPQCTLVFVQVYDS